MRLPQWRHKFIREKLPFEMEVGLLKRLGLERSRNLGLWVADLTSGINTGTWGTKSGGLVLSRAGCSHRGAQAPCFPGALATDCGPR